MFRRREREERKDDAVDLDDEPTEPSADVPEDRAVDLESQAADYLADNDVWLYGPNAPAVLAILDRLEEVGVADGTAIAEAWRGASKSGRDAARKAARRLTESSEELARHVQMVREEVGSWLAVAAEYPEFARAVPDWARVASQVGEAAIDAVTAVILEEELDEEQYQALWKPWTDATEAFQLEEDIEEVEAEEGLPETGEAGEAGEAGEFGPNTLAVVDFINRLWLLSPDQVTRLVSAWQETPTEDLEAAHEALHGLVEEDEEWRDDVRRAQEQITPWLNGGRLMETASFLGQTGQSVTRSMAGPALADAVAALVVGDLLEPEDAQTLYGPWFNLVGAPPLPEPEPDEDESAGETDTGNGQAGGAS
jgi:hypothetical protein